MLINLHSIIVDKPIPGLSGVTFNKCTTLADVLAAIITAGGATVVPAQTATTEQAADPHNLLGLSAGAEVTTQQLLDHFAAHLRDCCPDDTLEIPGSAFADPANPTQTEAQAWIDVQGPLKAGTQIIYNRYTNGDVEDPDYVWLVNEIGDATNIESPNPIKAGAGLRNATATGFTQNVAKNPAFSQIVYQENATATTGANSSITVQSPGRYLVTASVWWASETWLTECGIHGLINVNGTMVYAGGRLDHSRKLQTDPVNSGNSKFLSYATALTCILSLNAGDVVTFTVIHDDNTSHNLLNTGGYSWFQVEKLS